MALESIFSSSGNHMTLHFAMASLRGEIKDDYDWVMDTYNLLLQERDIFKAKKCFVTHMELALQITEYLSVLPEGNVSRNHIIHAAQAALTEKFCLNGSRLKGVQHVKSRIALLSADADQSTKIFEKSPEITAVLGGTVEKAEKWDYYILDYVPRLKRCIDGVHRRINCESHAGNGSRRHQV
ncbi:hypothetical protein EPUL_001521 [Erysiphe pulchra]|uniref:Uncharacterized protein n=1 Tax=Erysiphe pulchra TaxID=225359 RepID=A0A2S4PZJ5_9PEZI|nr:hypothetical protein EPUL_001521 [Erysiphe pulchra]